MKVESDGTTSYTLPDMELTPQKLEELEKKATRRNQVIMVTQIASAVGAVFTVIAGCFAVYRGSKAVVQGVDPRFPSVPAPNLTSTQNK